MLGDRGKGGGEEEDLQDKKADLELQYKKLQLNLHDILDRNEALNIENKGKDAVLTTKEKELLDLSRRNALEVEQLELEQTCRVEQLNHQLEAVSGNVVRSELQKERYMILQQENEDIYDAIQQIREDISAQERVHAKEMHRMNAFMRLERIRMENLFRNELVAMDMAFQNKAFLELDDDRKQAMFANTKLKDELGLLSVGLSALGVRYEKDTRSAKDARHNLEELEKSGRSLQHALKSLMTLKFGKRDTINQIKSDIKLFKTKKFELDSALSKGPSIPDLEKALFQTDVLLGREKREIAMWKERRRLMNLLKKEFKTATFSGGTNFLFDSMSRNTLGHSRAGSLRSTHTSLGYASTGCPDTSIDKSNGIPADLSQTAPAQLSGGGSMEGAGSSLANGGSLVSITTMNSSKRAPGPVGQRSNGCNVSGINLRSMTVDEKDLKRGLRKLIGKESMLLDAFNADPETNITAWSTAQIVEIFSTTAEQWKLSNDAVENELTALAEEAEREERRLQEAEDQAMLHAQDDASTDNNVLRILSQASIERAQSARSMGGVVVRMSSSDTASTAEESEYDEEDDNLFVGESIDEIINDMQTPAVNDPEPESLVIDVTEEDASGEINQIVAPSPLLLDIALSKSYETNGSILAPEERDGCATSPVVRFSNVMSPGIDSSAPTVKAGAGGYDDNGLDTERSDYDKNGLKKSYSTSAVIQQAQVEKFNDAERRSSYVGFRHDAGLEQLLAESQERINPLKSKSAIRRNVDFLPVKVHNKIGYLDGVEPPLATRKHLSTNVDISKLVDPRIVQRTGVANIMQGSKTEANLLKPQKGKPLMGTPSRMVSSSQNLNTLRNPHGVESNQGYLSSEALGKNINNIVGKFVQSPNDPLSGKATRKLQKKY